MKRRRLTHRIFLKSSPRYISVKGRLIWLAFGWLGLLVRLARVCVLEQGSVPWISRNSPTG